MTNEFLNLCALIVALLGFGLMIRMEIRSFMKWKKYEKFKRNK